MNKILERADSLYFQGKPTGLLDEEYDKLSEEAGHVCKPSNNAWAMFPDYPLLVPNFGLKRISYELAKNAVRYWPKWDGIFLQVFNDKINPCEFHAVTRGNGRTGKDLIRKFCIYGIPLMKRYDSRFVGIYWRVNNYCTNYELCYSIANGGREALCADIAKGVLGNYLLIEHKLHFEVGAPPRDIPSDFEGFPIDGWVCELQDGLKYKYKG